MAASPRPTFDQPTPIPYDKATRHVWGDSESGQVIDWIYVSSAKIHQLVFSLPLGGKFRHSEAHRTIFAADELYYVLCGTLAIANPETGEVHRVKTGEAAFFQRDTWHHGFNCGTEPLRVLEFFAPPPSQGTSGAYAKTKPNLTHLRYCQDQHLGHWPMARAEIRRTFAITILREADMLWRMEGTQAQALTGLLVSTAQLTAGKIFLLPGQETELEVHGGDESLYVLEGKLTLSVAAKDSSPWYELNSGDGFYIPEGIAHQYRNHSDKPVTVLFGVAPQYRAR